MINTTVNSTEIRYRYSSGVDLDGVVGAQPEIAKGLGT
jgi:hypothetical protein